MDTVNVQSFAEDTAISELLGYLKKIGNADGYKKVFDAVSYVNTLESTIQGMTKQISDMREKIQTVHEQNAYLMSRAERTAKDVLMDQLKKAENHMTELKNRLSDMKDALKQSAREMMGKVKAQRDKAVLRFADFIHVKNALSRLRDKVLDGKLKETQTANYFSDFYPVDCAVLPANASFCQKHGTLLPTESPL